MGYVSLTRLHSYKAYLQLSADVPVAYVLDYNIVVSDFELQSSYYVLFGTNAPFGKYKPPNPPQLKVKLYWLCSSTRITLALNNPQGLICNYAKQLNPTCRYYRTLDTLNWNKLYNWVSLHLRLFCPLNYLFIRVSHSPLRFLKAIEVTRQN